MTDLEKFKAQVEAYLNDTFEARSLSERDRDYYDHKQWTGEELKVLAARKQAPIVVNRIKPKIDGLKGLIIQRSGDPKAYPRTKKHEKSAEAITDAIRYLADKTDFNTGARLSVAEDFFIEGVGAAIVDAQPGRNNEVDISVSHIPWDRFYFDPRSRKADFSDARFKGLIVWLSNDEVSEKFPDVDPELLLHGSGGTDETFEDRPRWTDSQNNRVRVAYHYYRDQGAWWVTIFTGEMFLVEPAVSPHLDADGEPCCPIEAVGAYIDRDNARYGVVRGFIDQQNEINHRRSKALHLLSQRQTYARKGAVKDVAEFKSELAKPDGHVEFIGEAFGKDFGILPTSDMLRGQFELYQDAKNELDAVSFNAQLSGERASGDLSGVAIGRLQQAGVVEINGLLAQLSSWERRIYRQLWARIKQHWTGETWIRVTDDQDSLRWVGLNTTLTAQEWLEEKINDASLPLRERQEASASYQALMQNNDPALQAPVGVKNPVPEIDVDIILDIGLDSVTTQQEQFHALVQFAQGSKDIDILDIIEVSQLRNKKQLIDRIENRRKAQSEAQGGVLQLQTEAAKAKIGETMARGAVKQQEAIQKQIENTLLVAQPRPVTSVAV